MPQAMVWLKTFKYVVSVFVDVYLLLALIGAFRRINDFLPHFQRGFFCDDQSLRYAFKENTYEFGSLSLLSIAIPIGIIVLIDVVQNRSSLRSIGSEIYKSIISFAYGFLTHVFFTEVLKKSLGRLRPHFYEVCQPLLPDGLKCTKDNYIHDYVCSNDGSSSIFTNEIFKSFPSGHASFMFYGMTFLVLHIEIRIKSQWFVLLKAFFQFMCIIVAVVVSTSRITDNWHHWTDVVVGGAIGVVFAVWSIYLRFYSNRGLSALNLP